MVNSRVIFIVLLSLLFCVGAIGCDSRSQEDEVSKLKEKLGNCAIELSAEVFAKEIDLNDFNIQLVKEVTSEGELKEDFLVFEKIHDIENIKNVYFFASCKKVDHDILNIALIYDSKKEKTVKFGMRTINDESMVLKDLT